MAYNFSGKVALVTGSSSGIGRDLVVNLAKLGAQVVITGRSEDKIKVVVNECLEVSTADSPKVLPISADLQKDTDVQRLIDETIKTFKKLDILVNNAGFGAYAKITDDNFMEVFDSVFDTNVRGVLRLTKLAVPHLLKSKGANIINISSVASTKPRGIAVAYCTSKAALDMITRCLCDELSPQGIRVNSVNPAMIETPFAERLGLSSDQVEGMKQKFAAMYPIRRVGKVSDTTAVCLFLASDEASFITGVLLPVDGGFLNAASF